MRAIAPEPRRSLAIRALPPPESIVLAGKLGVFPAIPWASCFCAVSFRAFHRLPAVAVGTPTAQKIDNRSIANLPEHLPSSICYSKLAHGFMQVSLFISTA
jgi:hypothetical protein